MALSYKNQKTDLQSKSIDFFLDERAVKGLNGEIRGGWMFNRFGKRYKNRNWK